MLKYEIGVLGFWGFGVLGRNQRRNTKGQHNIDR